MGQLKRQEPTAYLGGAESEGDLHRKHKILKAYRPASVSKQSRHSMKSIEMSSNRLGDGSVIPEVNKFMNRQYPKKRPHTIQKNAVPGISLIKRNNAYGAPPDSQ